MKNFLPRHAALLAVCLCCAAGSALAEKPAWAGKGKPATDARGDGPGGPHGPAATQHFTDEMRRIILDYYGVQARKGHCPPGLAKKNNGCMPPGLAKQWQRGRPLPPGVVFHDLPREILLRLPPPPPHHRFVRIAGDILLIAIGTSIVLDAIEDIMH